MCEFGVSGFSTKQERSTDVFRPDQPPGVASVYTLQLAEHALELPN